MKRGLVLAPALIALAMTGCEPAEQIPEVDPGLVRRPSSQLPEALMLRFSEVKGSGSTRESWEVEILQMGGDVRVRGSVRTGGATLPVFHVMAPEDYVELWTWLRGFPVDRARLTEDDAAAATEWKKSLQVDVVLDESTRWKSRNSWTRPLLEAEWVDRIETRLHDLALNLAYRELDRQERDALAPEGPSSEDGPPLPGDRLQGLDVD